jgi:hypothetical protein
MQNDAASPSAAPFINGTFINESGIFVTGAGGGGPVGPTGDGILLEDGSSFLLAENSNYLILE